MIGYKNARNGTTRVVVTLEIPADAQTNMSRSSIAVPETAKYRANKAKVVAIEDSAGISYISATSFIYDYPSLISFVYNIGETMEEPAYNPDKEAVNEKGIDFFLSRRVAELYGLNKIENGLYQSWHINGRKAEETTYVDGKRHGLYQCWYDHGPKQTEATYVDGYLHGLYKSWHDNGAKHVESHYVDGKRHGVYQSWYENGQKNVDVTYVDDKRHGLYQVWYETGQKAEESTFVAGVVTPSSV